MKVQVCRPLIFFYLLLLKNFTKWCLNPPLTTIAKVNIPTNIPVNLKLLNNIVESMIIMKFLNFNDNYFFWFKRHVFSNISIDIHTGETTWKLCFFRWLTVKVVVKGRHFYIFCVLVCFIRDFILKIVLTKLFYIVPYDCLFLKRQWTATNDKCFHLSI